MRPAWTAGVTRGRLLLVRTIGEEMARSIADRSSLAEAAAELAGSAYGERVRADDLAAAERGVASTLVWHLRILAGWLPASGVALMRALAAWFELANIDARLAAFIGDGCEPEPFELGSLATAWPRAEGARTVEAMAAALSSSSWGHLAARSPAELALALRVAWARRVRDVAPVTAEWAAGAGALLAARELLVAGTADHVPLLRQLPGLGRVAPGVASPRDLQAGLPRHAAWALEGVRGPADLWRAELRWWDRVGRDAAALARSGGDEQAVVGIVALLAVDADRTVRALRTAASGGRRQLGELVDATA